MGMVASERQPMHRELSLVKAVPHSPAGILYHLEYIHKKRPL